MLLSENTSEIELTASRNIRKGDPVRLTRSGKVIPTSLTDALTGRVLFAGIAKVSAKRGERVVVVTSGQAVIE